MEILLIKLTSLGDVLHATGHVRTVRENFPQARITLVTASTSRDIFKHSDWVDEIVEFDRYAVKRDWFRRPRWTLRHMLAVIRRLRTRHYDLAIDLQGRWKSVIFLYSARAARRIVKGRWWFAERYRNPSVHAIEEMDGVLRRVGVTVRDSSMEIHTSADERQRVDRLLREINPRSAKIVVVSPFTRWESKNWGLENFARLIENLPRELLVIVTGFAGKRAEIDRAIAASAKESVVNLAGRLSLLEFAELVRRAELMVSGDSFPMHLASALRVPVIALFGPTDEARLGPVGERAVVLRAHEQCRHCPRRSRCRRRCVGEIRWQKVLEEARRQLAVAPAADARLPSVAT